MMKRLLAVVAVAALTGCNPPLMEGRGWAWDPSPAHPITVDQRPGTPDISTVWRWNAAAGTTLFATGGSDVRFEPMTPICPLGDCVNNRRAMWVERHRTNGYVDGCVIHYDPTYYPGNTTVWAPNVVAHEVGHCLDYGDVIPPTDYEGVFSYYRFWDPAWQAAKWWGPDDQAMLARDGYGP